MENDKTLKDFLKNHDACKEGYLFAKDLTLKEFLKRCDRGSWILWLFKRSNPESIKQLTLAKGYCANTVIHLMKDERSRKGVKAAIDFGEGRMTMEQLRPYADAAYAAARAATATARADAADAARVAYAAYTYADAARAAACAAWYFEVSFFENEKLSADICRQYLPLNIWNIN